MVYITSNFKIPEYQVTKIIMQKIADIEELKKYQLITDDYGLYTMFDRMGFNIQYTDKPLKVELYKLFVYKNIYDKSYYKMMIVGVE